MKHLKISISLLVLIILSLALIVNAQEDTSITVTDQLSLDGNVIIESVNSPAPGFVVIHADNGEGAPGSVIGTLHIREGISNDISIQIDAAKATPILFAMLHEDTGELGEYEFGSVEGADLPVRVEDVVVVQPMNVIILRAADQFLEDNTVTIASVTYDQPGFVVIHADADTSPGDVIGFTAVEAGTTINIEVELTGEATNVVWPMLHADTGVAGEYEFGTVEGEDLPASVNNRVAVLPIWTVAHVRVATQPIGSNNTVGIPAALLEEAGFVVIHADQDGAPGPVIGVSEPLDAGQTRNIFIELDGDFIDQKVWAMLHVDTGEAGVYEFGTVEGADGPVRVNESVVVEPFDILPPTDDMMMEPEMEMTEEAMMESEMEMTEEAMPEPEATEEPTG